MARDAREVPMVASNADDLEGDDLGSLLRACNVAVAARAAEVKRLAADRALRDALLRTNQCVDLVAVFAAARGAIAAANVSGCKISGSIRALWLEIVCTVTERQYERAGLLRAAIFRFALQDDVDADDATVVAWRQRLLLTVSRAGRKIYPFVVRCVCSMLVVLGGSNS